MPATHVLSAAPETVHWGYFDARLAPRLSVDSGDTVTLHCVSGGPVEVGARARRLMREHCAYTKPMRRFFVGSGGAMSWRMATRIPTIA